MCKGAINLRTKIKPLEEESHTNPLSNFEASKGPTSNAARSPF